MHRAFVVPEIARRALDGHVGMQTAIDSIKLKVE